jgi:hypothetical protein
MHMVAMLLIHSPPLAIPAYIKSCVGASHRGPYTLTRKYDEDDILTEILVDTPGEPPVDWWQTGQPASLNICDYLVAWKRHEGQNRQKVISPVYFMSPGHSFLPSQLLNTLIDVKLMTTSDIDRRLARLGALKISLLEKYNRLLADQAAILKEQNTLRWCMEDADRLELEAFKQKYN